MKPVVGQPVPRELGEARVLDAAAGEHGLGEQWRHRDALVVFVRHFACSGCSEHIAILRPRLPELAMLGVAVVIVGSGSAEQLAAFVEREGVGSDGAQCFTDPTLAAYRAAGFMRSRWGTFGPIAAAQYVRARLHGHRNGLAQGDLYQQGGTLYVTRAGVVAFYFGAASLGDHAPLADLVDIALAERAAEAEGA